MSTSTKNPNNEMFMTKLIKLLVKISKNLLDLSKYIIPKSLNNKIKSMGENIYFILMAFILLIIIGIIYYFFINKILSLLRIFIIFIAVYLSYIIIKFNLNKKYKKYETNLNILCSKNENKNSNECKL